MKIGRPTLRLFQADPPPHAPVTRTPGRRRYDTAYPLTLWAVAGALAVPVVTLLHELGHLIAASILQLPHPSIHWASVDFHNSAAFWHAVRRGSAASLIAGVSATRVAAVAIAGPLATLLTGAFCAWRARRGDRNPLVLTTGLFATTFGLIQVIVTHLPTLEPTIRGAMDEALAARLIHAPSALLTVPEAAALLLLGLQTRRAISDRRRPSLLWAIALGFVWGVTLYGYVIGPLLLP